MNVTDQPGSYLDRAFRMLVAPRTAFWLLGAWLALLVVWVLPFTLAGQSEDTVGAIALEWVPLQVLYWLIGVTTALCVFNRAARDLRRVRREGVPARARSLGDEAEALPGVSLERLQERLEARGFDVTGEHGALHAVRGRWRPLWGSVLHLALLLLVGALALNAATARTAGIELIEGQTADEFYAGTASRPDTLAFKSALGDFKLTSVSPRFFDRYLLFMKLEARADWRGKSRLLARTAPLVEPGVLHQHPGFQLRAQDRHEKRVGHRGR